MGGMSISSVGGFRVEATKSGNRAENPQISFDAMLQESRQKLKFSSHAMQRLDARNIVLSEQSLEKLERVVDRMAEKGARKSAIFMDAAALVVSVPNRIVITAVDEESAKENIFTNIDSAAVL